MGMYSFEIVPVPNLASIFEYDISVIALSDGSITTNEVLQLTLNDTFTNVTVTAPEQTKASYEENVLTWEIGSLDAVARDIPLVLKVNLEHPTALEEGALIASAITNTFLNEQGEEMIETYEDFTFEPPTNSSFKLDIGVTPLLNCQYRLDFTATNTSNVRIDNIVLNYLLDAANFIWVTPPPAPSTITEWPIGTLTTTGSGKTKTQSAIIQFIGTTTGIKTIFASITASAPNTQAFTGIKSLSTDVTDTCVSPCCEKCPKGVEVPFVECEQSQNVTVTPEIESDGKEIKVKVTIDAACRQRRVVVGLELFEKQADGTLVRIALKVLDLPPVTNTGCAKRECDCATFFIPSSSCTPVQFVVKAQAHYFAIGNSPCRCNCPTSAF